MYTGLEFNLESTVIAGETRLWFKNWGLLGLVPRTSISQPSTLSHSWANAWLAYGNKACRIGAILFTLLSDFFSPHSLLWCLGPFSGNSEAKRKLAVKNMEELPWSESFKLVWWHFFAFDFSSRKRTQDLFNAMGSMYAAVLFLGVQNASSVQPVVAVERTVFYREKAAGMYSALPYAFAQVDELLQV